METAHVEIPISNWLFQIYDHSALVRVTGLPSSTDDPESFRDSVINSSTSREANQIRQLVVAYNMFEPSFHISVHHLAALTGLRNLTIALNPDTASDELVTARADLKTVLGLRLMSHKSAYTPRGENDHVAAGQSLGSTKHHVSTRNYQAL